MDTLTATILVVTLPVLAAPTIEIAVKRPKTFLEMTADARAFAEAPLHESAAMRSSADVREEDAPAAQGAEAIAEVWKGFFQLKDFTLTFEPARISVAHARDVAYDIGTYSPAFDGDQGSVRDRGNYVVVWKKVRGDWKVAADIFNSEGIAPSCVRALGEHVLVSRFRSLPIKGICDRYHSWPLRLGTD